MCVVSMINDHFRERWAPLVQQPSPVFLPVVFPPPAPLVSEEEVAEFRRLLERAREYDKRHGEPHCEMAEKKQALKAIADQLGIDISFIEADGA